MTKWHPATKLLLLAALLVLPYLLWTSSEEPSVAVVARAASVRDSAPATEPAPVPLVLPPLEVFTAVVERPLFSPSRRMPLPPPAEELLDAPRAPSEPVDLGPPEPDVRFFGSAAKDGVVAALVSLPATAEVARLRPGDTVQDWEVISVERNRLVLGLGDQRRSYEIFGSGIRGAAPDDPDKLDPEEDAMPADDEAILE